MGWFGNKREEVVVSSGSEFRDSSKSFLIAIVLVALLGVGAWISARPAYRIVKRHRALGMVSSTSAEIDAGKWVEAGRSLKVLLEMAPGEPKVLRLAARFCTKRSMQEGFNYWQLVLASPEGTYEDHLGYAELAVMFNRADIAGPELRGLLKTNRTDEALCRLYLRHLRNTDSPAAAILGARFWLESFPNSEEAEMMLGLLLSAASDANERAEGRRLLWSLAVGHGPFRNEAVDILVPSSELNSAENQILLTALGDRKDRRAWHYELRMKMDPAHGPAILDEYEQEARQAGTPEALAEAVGWFAQRGETKRSLALLPTEVVRKYTNLVSARLQILLELDRSEEVKPYLESDKGGIEPYLAQCLQAAAAQKVGQSQIVMSYFLSAIAACTNQPSRLRFVAGYAERIGQPMAAIYAYEKLMSWPPATYSAGREVLRLLGSVDDTKRAWEALTRLAKFLPGDEALFTSSTYFGFLLGERQPGVKARLEALAQAQEKEKNKDPIFGLILALAEYREGNASKALGLIEGLEVDWSHAEPRMRALYAAVLGANGQRAAARDMARKVDATRLRPEERELLKGAL